MDTHVFRLEPGQPLRESIEEYCRANRLHSACILTCVGSLTLARLRMAGAEEPTERNGPFEILSLVGICCETGSHLHCALSDSDGAVWGGHLSRGSLVHTTAEIVLQALPVKLSRQPCPKSGYDELVVHRD
jgi:predicted DNA-binding protein with PD1-like motif